MSPVADATWCTPRIIASPLLRLVLRRHKPRETTERPRRTGGDRQRGLRPVRPGHPRRPRPALRRPAGVVPRPPPRRHATSTPLPAATTSPPSSSPPHLVQPVAQRAHLRAGEGEGMLLDADPPTHTWQRRLLQKAWTPRLVNRLEPRVRAVAEVLVDAVHAAGRCEFHEAFGGPLPVTMVAELIGVPTADGARFKAWSEAGVEVTAGTPGAQARAKDVRHDMVEYFDDHVAARRRLMATGAEVARRLHHDDVAGDLRRAAARGRRGPQGLAAAAAGRHRDHDRCC